MSTHLKLGLTVATFAAALLTAGAAGAAVYGAAPQSDPAGPTPVTDFERIDANGDGLITPQEFRAVRAHNRWLGHFSRYDANHDGVIVLNEFTSAEEMHLPVLKDLASR